MMLMEDFYLSRALFRTYEIKDDFANERSMRVKLKALTENGRIEKIKNGLYATVNSLTGDIFASRFEIASALFENACVAYHSALEFHGLGNQMFSEVQVFTEKRYNPFMYNGLEYKFFSYTAKGGIMRLEQNAEIVVTDLERTVVDCIDRIDLAGGIEELVTALNCITHLDEQALLTYLKEYNKKFVYKKAGFLLSLLKKDLLSQNFFDICKQNCSIKLEDISENKKTKHKVSFVNGHPFIECEIWLTGNVPTMYDSINLSDENCINVLNEELSSYIETQVSSYLYKTSKVYQSDIAGFGEYVKPKYLTWQEWIDSDWLRQLFKFIF